MKIAALFLPLFATIGTASAGGLRRTQDSVQSPLDTHRGLTTALDTVIYGIERYFDEYKCYVDAGLQSTTVKCTAPGYTATLVTEDYIPKTLKVCEVYPTYEKCQFYRFTSSTNVSDLVSRAFAPLANLKKTDYYYIVDALYDYYYFSCDINPKNFNYEGQYGNVPDKHAFECSLPGYSAKLISKGYENPTPLRLQVCYKSNGRTQCDTYRFDNGSYNLSQIFAKAFPHNYRYHYAYYELANYLYFAFDGYCELRPYQANEDADFGNLPAGTKYVYHCTSSKYIVKFISSDYNPLRLKVCTTADKKCAQYVFDNQSNVVSVIGQLKQILH